MCKCANKLKTLSKNAWSQILKTAWTWQKCSNMISSPWCLSLSKYQSRLLCVLQHKLSSSNLFCLLSIRMLWILRVHHRWKPQIGKSERSVCFSICRLLLRTSSELWKQQKTCMMLDILVVTEMSLLALKEDLLICTPLLRRTETTASVRMAKLWPQQEMGHRLQPRKKEKITLWLASLIPWVQLPKSWRTRWHLLQTKSWDSTLKTCQHR